MTDLEQRVLEAWAQGNVGAGEHFHRRPGQIEMARRVAHAIARRGTLVVEAGTGTGKTFAYLVPLLLSGQRAVLSTATHLLQAQLAQRDIPAVSRWLGLPVRVAVLKGRSSYVCLHRLEQACRENGGRLRDPALSVRLDAIRHWAQGSEHGDFSELAGWDAHSPLAALAGSTRENCLRHACPRIADCHYLRARRKAVEADWVVVNHHLFFADVASEPFGGTGVLEDKRVMVFDEAHRLCEAGTQQLAVGVGARRLSAFARDLVKQGNLWARGLRAWSHLGLTIDQTVAHIDRLAKRAGLAGHRSRWAGGAPEGLSADAWFEAAVAVDAALRSAHESLRGTATASPELSTLLVRAHDLVLQWRGLAQGDGAGEAHRVAWVDWGEQGAGAANWSLLSGSTDLAGLFHQVMARTEGEECSWIFTSATLGTDGSLSWFTGRLGLAAREDLQTTRIPGPFHMETQMALFVPLCLPMPSEPEHSIALADAVAQWTSQLGGRTLVLTTTRKAALRIAQRLRWQAGQGGFATLKVLDETMLAREGLLDRFRVAGASSSGAVESSPHATVLVASMAFWEGVDLAGDVLQLLVIDKLPFPPPDDPLIEARSRQLSEQGLDPFDHGMLPEAGLSLRQGIGRLIRSTTDRGVAVIGDKRLLLREYGQALLAGLPPHRQLVNEAELMLELARLRLTRASTRGQNPS